LFLADPLFLLIKDATIHLEKLHHRLPWLTGVVGVVVVWKTKKKKKKKKEKKGLFGQANCENCNQARSPHFWGQITQVMQVWCKIVITPKIQTKADTLIRQPPS